VAQTGQGAAEDCDLREKCARCAVKTKIRRIARLPTGAANVQKTSQRYCEAIQRLGGTNSTSLNLPKDFGILAPSQSSASRLYFL
jgi:hypothetical protein